MRYGAADERRVATRKTVDEGRAQRRNDRSCKVPRNCDANDGGPHLSWESLSPEPKWQNKCAVLCYGMRRNGRQIDAMHVKSMRRNGRQIDAMYVRQDSINDDRQTHTRTLHITVTLRRRAKRRDTACSQVHSYIQLPNSQIVCLFL